VITEETRMKAARAAACLAIVVGIAVPSWAQQEQVGERPGVAGVPGAALDQKRPAPQPPPKPKPKAPPLTAAQLAQRQPGRPGSWEVSAGAAWLGPGSLGSSTANLTTNGSTTPYRYFVASADMGGAPALDARVAYNLTRRLTLEGGATYGSPQVRVNIASDAEGASAISAPAEKLSQYFLDANLLLFLPKMSFARGRGRAFVEGGGGYLRQLHEGRFNVDTGKVYSGGAGVKYYFKPRPRGLVKGFGLRVDLRAYYKSGGYSFDGANTWTAALAAAGVVAF
jgi:hypothetical protein